MVKKQEEIIKLRIKQLEESKPKLKYIKKDSRKHPAFKQWKGKLTEAKYILKLINKQGGN